MRLVVGLPLMVFLIWARLPGHMAAPFELAMLLPVTAAILGGILYYFAGMLTGLRQARWYGSRVLGLGVAVSVTCLVLIWPECWQAFLSIFIGMAILATAVWGGFQSHGYYEGQPAWGKAALTFSIMLGCLLVAGIIAAVSISFLSSGSQTKLSTTYALTLDGAVFKVTRGPGMASEIVDLDGKPLMDAKTGRMIEFSSFNHRDAKAIHIEPGLNNFIGAQQWLHPESSLSIPWRATSDTLWFYWSRYGRLVGYDIASRRCIGSLGPNGFSEDLSGGGVRFSNPGQVRRSRTLWTPTTLYRIDFEKRAVKPLFTTPSDDPILAPTEINSDDYDWEYTAVVTKRLVHLLTAEGKPLWQAPYERAGTASSRMEVYLLEPPGQFALWIGPSYWAQLHAKGYLTNHVTWLAQGQGVRPKRGAAGVACLPPLAYAGTAALCAVAPPVLLMMLPHLPFGSWVAELAHGQSWMSWAGAVLVCLPIGLWLGRRYQFSFAALAGWGVFLVLFGVPGLLAFLSVQEWPAREACPNCKRLRLVDRAQCEHCGAAFAPPEKTGTEVFAAMGAGSGTPVVSGG